MFKQTGMLKSCKKKVPAKRKLNSFFASLSVVVGLYCLFLFLFVLLFCFGSLLRLMFSWIMYQKKEHPFNFTRVLSYGIISSERRTANKSYIVGSDHD